MKDLGCYQHILQIGHLELNKYSQIKYIEHNIHIITLHPLLQHELLLPYQLAHPHAFPHPSLTDGKTHSSPLATSPF